MLRFKNLVILILLASLAPVDYAKGSDIEQSTSERAKATPKYSDWNNITYDSFIERCMPKLTTRKQRIAAAKVYEALVKVRPKPINEGNPQSVANIGKVLPEGGYSFPPHMHLQGPLLEYCGTGNFKRVLEIGPGHGGADTIPLLLTHNVQVIANDIYKAQLEELESNVNEVLRQSFPSLVGRLAPLKRNFADKDTEVPSKYLGAFEAVNLSRVLHFLNGQQTRTMLYNVASMIKEGGFLSITVSTLKEGSKEAIWVTEQKEQGLEDPNLVYYETTKRIRKNPRLGQKDLSQLGDMQMVQRRNCGLPDPGHKIEFSKPSDPINGIPAFFNILRQGRHYHTLESLKPFLDSYFRIIDHMIYDYDGEDIFLAIIAEKKPKIS